MARKVYTDLNDLLAALDNESLMEDEDMDLLEDDDLALLHGPRITLPPSRPRPRKRPGAKKPRPTRTSHMYQHIDAVKGEKTDAQIHRRRRLKRKLKGWTRNSSHF